MPEIELTKKEERELLAKGLFSSPFFTIVASVVATFIIAYLFSKVGGEVPIQISSTTQEKQHTFDVTGEGKAQVVPDVARANFGITVTRSTVASAQKDANQVINALTETLERLEVEEKDIRTISYNIGPDYSFNEGRSRIIGYNINSQLEITFRDFSVLNQAIEAATAAGANLTGNLRFELSDEAKQSAEDKARKEAVDQARTKAERLAQLSGVSLGKVVNVQEVPMSEPPPIFRSLAREGNPEEQALDVSPGLSEVKIRVTLSFETK